MPRLRSPCARRAPRAWRAGLLATLATLGACSGLPPDAFRLPPTSLEDRAIQSRKFTTTDSTLLLSAGAGVLQDLGYAIDESDAPLGVLTASKEVTAKDAAEMVGAIMMSILIQSPTPWSDHQEIRVCLVIKTAADDPEASVARITIQRTVWNTENQITRSETIDDPEIYQAFFEKLSKATFLEANEI